MVELDDLDVRHEARGLLGELHHQHGADGEVGREEQARALGRELGELGELLLREPGRAHDAVDAGGERDAQVALDDGRGA